MYRWKEDNRFLALLLACLSIVVLPSLAWADNLGAIGSGGALVVIILGLPMLLCGLASVVFAAILTFSDLAEPVTRKIKVLSVLSMVASGFYIVFVVGIFLVLGRELRSTPLYAIMILPACGVPGSILGLVRVSSKTLGRSGWLVMRLLTWGLPALSVFVLFLIYSAPTHFN